LGLGGRVSVFESDARRLASTVGERADVVVARAFVGPKELFRISHPLLKSSGHLIVMAGDRDVSQEYESAHGFALERSRRFELPGGAEKRSITIARRLG
jgi:16S rRNA G527 N7-methylase RsmG